MGFLDGLFASKNSPGAADFAMRVEMIFGITGRGAVVTGKVDAGAISSGDLVYFTSSHGESKSCRVDLQLDEKTHPGVKTATAGMNAGLMLRGVEKEEVTEGSMIFGAPQ